LSSQTMKTNWEVTLYLGFVGVLRGVGRYSKRMEYEKRIWI
jgi:hypothetical protein